MQFFLYEFSQDMIISANSKNVTKIALAFSTLNTGKPPHQHQGLQIMLLLSLLKLVYCLDRNLMKTYHFNKKLLKTKVRTNEDTRKRNPNMYITLFLTNGEYSINYHSLHIFYKK